MGRLATAAAERSSLAIPEKWVVDWFKGGTATPAGVFVTEDTALHYGPFFAGIRNISQDVGSLPFPVYRHLDPRGKERARDHRIHTILNDEPNPMMPAHVFREVLTGHAITWGGGFGEIVADGRGEIVAVWPLRPDRMKVKRVGPKRRRLVYRYEDPTNGIVQDFRPDQILHVYGFGFNGVTGYSAVEMARKTIGAGVAAEEFGGRFFGNGSLPGGVLTHPGVVSDTGKKNMRESWERIHKGPDNAQRIAILEEGVTWQQIGIPPGDAQFLESRKNSVVEMARWLRLPPHKLQELDRATWNNIEHSQIEYVSETLRIWLNTWEAAVRLRLFTAFERDTFFAEHVVEGLLRGDMKTRFEGYRVGREMGVYSADDIRELENRNPLPDGKGSVYMVPLNWVEAPSPGDNEPPRAARRSRSAETRRRIARAYRPKLADVDERLAKLERREVTKLVKAHFRSGRRNSLSSFAADLEDLFEGTILEETISRWLPVLLALATDISVEAADELALDEPDALDEWAQSYVTAHSAYRIGSARRQILAIATDLAESPEDLVDAVLAHLDEVVAVRPEQAAFWESMQMSNAATRETWLRAGVKKIRWSAQGDSCPYCSKLDGKVVGIEQTFVSAGDVLTGGDDDEQIEVKRNTYAPPVHPGCDCTIVEG